MFMEEKQQLDSLQWEPSRQQALHRTSQAISCLA